VALPEIPDVAKVLKERINGLCVGIAITGIGGQRRPSDYFLVILTCLATLSKGLNVLRWSIVIPKRALPYLSHGGYKKWH
jgi:hypothetical protein